MTDPDRRLVVVGLVPGHRRVVAVELEHDHPRPEAVAFERLAPPTPGQIAAAMTGDALTGQRAIVPVVGVPVVDVDVHDHVGGHARAYRAGRRWRRRKSSTAATAPALASW